jgi:ACS family tartrate transporter-like MFS transporter
LAAYFWPSPFWALPTLTLTASAAAVSIGFINMCANLAGYLGNHINGWLHDRGASETACLLFLAACYFLGGVLVSFVTVPAKVAVRLGTAPPQPVKA